MSVGGRYQDEPHFPFFSAKMIKLGRMLKEWRYSWILAAILEQIFRDLGWGVGTDVLKYLLILLKVSFIANLGIDFNIWWLKDQSKVANESLKILIDILASYQSISPKIYWGPLTVINKDSDFYTYHRISKFLIQIHANVFSKIFAGLKILI